MDNELKKLDEILKNFPIDKNSKRMVEFVLENISTEDAALVWKYAQKYLAIAKEMDVSK